MRDEEKQLRIAKLRAELPLEIRLSVTVSDGSFEGSLSCPVDGDAETFKKTAAAWMQMLHQALMLTKEVGESPKITERL